jgi:hypothetical protein
MLLIWVRLRAGPQVWWRYGRTSRIDDRVCSWSGCALEHADAALLAANNSAGPAAPLVDAIDATSTLSADAQNCLPAYCPEPRQW